MPKKIKFIPVNVPKLYKEEKYNILKCIKTNWISSEGKFVNDFEKNFSKYNTRKYGIAVSSGTAALEIAIKSLNLKAKSEVIIPAFSIISTALCVIKNGLKPILVDCDLKTWNMNPNEIIKRINKKTSAIIITHIYGLPVNLSKVVSIAKKKKIKIIEDAAEAMFSKYKKKYLGTYGDCGCFSFSPNKIINSGQGGMIITNNYKVFNNLRKLKDQGRINRGSGGDDMHDFIGYNFKYTNLQAATALAQLKRFKKRKKTLTENYKFYKKNLIQNENFYLIEQNIRHGNFPLWVDAYCKDRDRLVNQLKRNNIGTRNYWFPLNENRPYKKDIKFFKNTKLLLNKLFWLPSTFNMKKSDLKKICKVVNNFNKNNYG